MTNAGPNERAGSMVFASRSNENSPKHQMLSLTPTNSSKYEQSKSIIPRTFVTMASLSRSSSFLLSILSVFVFVNERRWVNDRRYHADRPVGYKPRTTLSLVDLVEFDDW